MRPAELVELELGRAVALHQAGELSELEYRAYRRAWADAGGSRAGYRHALGWSGPDASPAVEELAAELVELAAARLRRRADRQGWGFVPVRCASHDRYDGCGEAIGV